MVKVLFAGSSNALHISIMLTDAARTALQSHILTVVVAAMAHAENDSETLAALAQFFADAKEIYDAHIRPA